jgi:integral membrane sensor domain MASE1
MSSCQPLFKMQAGVAHNLSGMIGSMCLFWVRKEAEEGQHGSWYAWRVG